METIREVAEAIIKNSEFKTREGSISKFVCFDFDAIENGKIIQNAVREGHLGKLPNDFEYQVIYDVCQCIDDAQEDRDFSSIDDVFDYLLNDECLNADLEYYKLFQWVASNYEYCDQTMGDGYNNDFIGIIQAGQSMHKREIAYAFLSHLFNKLELD